MTTEPVTADAFTPLRVLADAILYEGYLLYPYRRSSGKNRVRWQFGVLTPPDWTRARGADDTGVAGSAECWWQRTEALVVAGPGASVDCRVRFLQLQRKTVEERTPTGYRPVALVRTPDRVETAFEEAVPCEVDFRAPLEPGAPERVHPITVPGGTDIVEVDGARVVRRREPLEAVVRLSAVAAGEGPEGPVVRVSLRVENTQRDIPTDLARDRVLARSLLACHCLLSVRGGVFVSLLDPPEWAVRAVRECANVHTFPVLAGDGDGQDSELVLSSPILLYDRPRVAPESPGDLHDSGEIDEILTLRTLTLTEEEKAEARATDARAAAILDRVDGMPPEVFERLHGAVRSFGPICPAGGDPEASSVLVGGVRVAAGSRVRLRPRTRGTDPQDRFLDGRTALVEKVMSDVDDVTHLAVTLEDDPAAELNRWYGRYRYFTTDEVEPVEQGR